MTNEETVLFEDAGTECKRLVEWGYPYALAKACCDPFSYALGLRNGWIIEFESATPVSRDWVALNLYPDGCYGQCEPSPDRSRFCFDRGLEVRISDIIWCADAPHGS